MPLHQAHHGRDPVEDGALLGSLDQRHQPLRVAVPTADGVAEAAQHVLEPLAQDVGVEVGDLHELRDLALEVVLEPRERRELELVGDLVQADPEPEVRRVDPELLLGGDDVRGDEQQPAAGAEDLVLPEHAGGEEGEQAAGLHAGDA